MGMNVGQTLGGVMNAPIESIPQTPEVRLASLKSMFDQSLISQEEFDKKKADIISSI
jgi:hypothetical protein